MSALLPAHREHLRSSGLNDATIDAALICSLDERETRALGYARGLTGIGFPYIGTEIQVDGQRHAYTRLRVDEARVRSPGQKYENPLRARLQAGLPYYPYVPPGVGQLRKDEHSPIFVTEGEKKALKMTQEGWPTIGLPGVFLFVDPRSKKHAADKPLHPDLLRWRLRGRTVFVCFDSDRTSKDGVALAHERLCAGLTRRGARVLVVVIPLLEGQSKTGADDFLVAQGREAFAELVEAAEPWVPFAWLVELLPDELPRDTLATALEPFHKRMRGACRRELLAVAQILADRVPGLSPEEALELLPVDAPDKPPEGGPLPKIITNNRQLRTMVADGWDALIDSARGRLLFRYGDGLTLAPRTTAAAGEPFKLREVDLPLLSALLNRAADWMHLGREGEQRPARLPADLTRDMLAMPDPRLRQLDVLSRLPVLAKHGEVHGEGGYDPASRIFHVADPAVLACLSSLPEQPDDRDCASALDYLQQELLGDFPFVRDSDRAHCLAALLLPFVRHLIRGPTPLHLLEAPSEGTGKGLLADALHRIATASGAQATPLPNNEEEIRKKITSELIAGRSLILLDNVDHSIDSASLAAVLTTTIWSDRLLGQSKMVTVPNRAMWMATGNNPTVSREIGRRVVRIRLDADCEHPWLRVGFRHDNLKRWVASHRGQLVVAALTLLRSWAQAGRPSGSVVLGSFEDWAAILGGILEHHGVRGFLGDRRDQHVPSDPEEDEWVSFIPRWLEAFDEEATTARALMELAMELELFDLGGRGSGERGAKSRFSQALAKRRDRRYGEFRLMVGRDAKRKVNTYRLQRSAGEGEGRAKAS